MDTRSIVVIDDSQVVCKILEVGLHRADYQVKCFADPIDALQAIRQARGESQPDLLIVDLGLPRIDGYEVIRLVRSSPEYVHTPIVVLSGRDGVLDRLKARLAGADVYLTKPFTIQQVTATLARLLQRA